MTRLGLVTVKDVMLVPQRILIAFQTTRSTFSIPRSYTFIWDKFEWLLSNIYHRMSQIPNLDGGSQELSWTFD